MKKRKPFIVVTVIICIICFVFSFVVFCGCLDKKDDFIFDLNKLSIKNFFYHIKNGKQGKQLYLTFEAVDEGYDIYNPIRLGYRYGPSIIYYEDGSMDAWFASNGNSSTQWDWITYRHYNGENWSDEEIVLRPTVDSRDHYSACDPGVIFFDGYYYIGYTSTENADKGGIENSIYVARSANPNGPYEKWNGEDWGGNPWPIIEYKENDGGWGAGEISFVVIGEKLYCYYSWIDANNNSYIKLGIAPIQEDWPKHLEDKGIVITRKNGQGSMDFVYDDLYGKVLGICVENSFEKGSSIAIYQTNDEYKFEQVDTIKDNISNYAHNIGVSKKLDGHVNVNDNLCIGYAYSSGSNRVWGSWSTKIQQVKFKTNYR